MSSGSMQWSFLLTSAKTGIAPAWTTENDVAMKVYDGTITSSPGPIPRLAMAVWRALVPLVVVMHYLDPFHWANLFSNFMPS